MVLGRKDRDKAERWEKELEDTWYAYVQQVSLSRQKKKSKDLFVFL